MSADGFQSADTIQLLTTAGYNAKVISLDRTPAGYLAFKSAINEERLDLLDLDKSKLEYEIIELERDGMSGKIDHPVEGSKDISDSLCGAIYGASLYKLSEQMKHATDDFTLTSELLSADLVNSDVAMTNSMLGLDSSTHVIKSMNDYAMTNSSDIIDW